jgi:hypothetical protein
MDKSRIIIRVEYIGCMGEMGHTWDKMALVVKLKEIYKHET